jgi:hypothetical protein
MNIKKILFYLLAGILGGCVPVVSLHPLYTEKDVFFDERLIGNWITEKEFNAQNHTVNLIDSNNQTIWQFTRPDKKEKIYTLTYCDKKNQKGLFAVHLVKLKNKFFLDASPVQVLYDSNDPNKAEELAYNTIFIIPAHIFAIVDSFEPQLKLRLTDDEQMKNMLEEDPKAIKNEQVEGRAILTASTQQLQKFVLKYADSEKVFVKGVILSRKNVGDANDAIKTKESSKSRLIKIRNNEK